MRQIAVSGLRLIILSACGVGARNSQEPQNFANCASKKEHSTEERSKEDLPNKGPAPRVDIEGIGSTLKHETANNKN
jgi:hypothetical protein